MGNIGLFPILAAMILLCYLRPACSWGKEGHYVVCKIAEELLTKEAYAGVKSLLPEYADGDLASLCSWADEIRFRAGWHWTGPLHYVDTPDFRCNYNYSRDCHYGKHPNMCVSGAIYNYSAQLMAHHLSDSHAKYNLTEALLFLSHFVGDIHQPLHVGFLGDEGGNTITVHWYKRKTNLHHVWDTMIIESALKQFYKSDLATMIKSIQKNIMDDPGTILPSWGNCKLNQSICPNQYASESISFACRFAYRNATPGSTLGDDYFLSRLPIVEKRLAQAGVRLAASLNRIFHSQHPFTRLPVERTETWEGTQIRSTILTPSTGINITGGSAF